jgi:hypothetical protein
LTYEFYCNVWNQRESFIYPDLIIKNIEVTTEKRSILNGEPVPNYRELGTKIINLLIM